MGRIVEAAIRPLLQPLADPAWRYASAAIATVPGFVVRLTDEIGHAGLGYTRAMPPTGLPPAAMEALLRYLLDGVAGLETDDPQVVMEALGRQSHGQPMAVAAVECALLDLRARARGQPLYELLGACRPSKSPQARILPLKTPDDMAAYARDLLDRGYRFLKVKASGDAELDLARIRAVGRAAQERARLMVDANQSYSVDAALAVLPRMAEAGVELVEQPTHADDQPGFEKVCRASPIPIEADESAQSLQMISHLTANGIARSINLRILNLGGVGNVLKAAEMCQKAGVACRLGASFGPRLLGAFTAHLAALLPEPLFAHEIAEFEHILDDPFEGLEIENGDLQLSSRAGVGVVWRASVPQRFIAVSA